MLDPGRSIAGILDRARPLLRRAPMIAPHESADQGVGRLQQTHHHANRIPEETAVARLMHERVGDRAVEPHDLAGLDFLLTRAGEQDAIDRLPCLGPDGADGHVQHQLLRGPRQRQPGEGAERGGVFQMKRQLLVAQLAMLLEKPTAQDRLCRQTLSPVSLTPCRRRSSATSPMSSRSSSSHWDIAFSSRPISCSAKRSNMLAWTVRSGRIVGSGGGGFACGISGLIPKLTRNRRALHSLKQRFHEQLQLLGVYGRTLAKGSSVEEDRGAGELDAGEENLGELVVTRELLAKRSKTELSVAIIFV